MQSMRDTSTTNGAASSGCATRSTTAANFLFNLMSAVIVHSDIDNDFRARDARVEGRNMRANHLWLKRITKSGFLLMMGVSMNADAGLFGIGGASWKEEVLLLDGSKLIVKRSQTRGGRHEIGQEVPINSHKISFTLPGTREAITWETTIGLKDSDSSLGLLALNIVKGVPYIVASTYGCHAYNKWGRPNPPYVFFKYGEKAWQRISLEAFPTEIKEANVVIETQEHEHQLDSRTGVVTAAEIKSINGTFSHDAIYLQVFVREEILSSDNAPELGCSKFQ